MVRTRRELGGCERSFGCLAMMTRVDLGIGIIHGGGRVMVFDIWLVGHVVTAAAEERHGGCRSFRGQRMEDIIELGEREREGAREYD